MSREILLEQVGMKLVLLARLYRRELDKALKPYGLTEAAALPIRYLARLEHGTGQARLVEVLNIEGPTLVRTLNHLVECGLVERETDDEDRRANIVRLTPEGKQFSMSLRQTLQTVRAELFSNISDSEIKIMLGVLDTLQENLDQF